MARRCSNHDSIAVAQMRSASVNQLVDCGSSIDGDLDPRFRRRARLPLPEHRPLPPSEESSQLPRRDRHHHSRRRLAKSAAVSRYLVDASGTPAKIHIDPEWRVEAAFGQRHGHAAFDAVVCRADHA